jgi:hypothetical protein
MNTDGSESAAALRIALEKPAKAGDVAAIATRVEGKPGEMPERPKGLPC